MPQNALAQEINIEVLNPAFYGRILNVTITGCLNNPAIHAQCEVKLYHGDNQFKTSKYCYRENASESCQLSFELPKQEPSQATISVLSDHTELEDRERILKEQTINLSYQTIVFDNIPDETDYGSHISGAVVRGCQNHPKIINNCEIWLYHGDVQFKKLATCSKNNGECFLDKFKLPGEEPNQASITVLSDQSGTAEQRRLGEQDITLTDKPACVEYYGGVLTDEESPEISFISECGRKQYEVCYDQSNKLRGCCQAKKDCTPIVNKLSGSSGCKPGDKDCTSGGGKEVPGCTDVKGNPGVATAIGCIHTNPTELTKDVLTFTIGISGGLAFLMMLLGAFQMLTSAGNPETLNAGKDRLTSAIIGLLFIVFAVLLLQIIGVGILSIPGFGKGLPNKFI